MKAVLLAVAFMAVFLTAPPLSGQDGDFECVVLFADSLETVEMNESISGDFPNTDNQIHYFTVVVHVLYDPLQTSPTSPDGNISFEQVKSQIEYINAFLANEGVAHHPENTPIPVRLKLATVDPEGNPTNGVNWVDGVEKFGTAFHEYGMLSSANSAYPGAPTPQIITSVASDITWMNIPGTDKRYFNIYTAPKINGSYGSGVQAFAFFPTTSRVFGAYGLSNVFGSIHFQNPGDSFDIKPGQDEGKTMVHEIGHNLALYHTFQSTTYPQCIEGETNCEIQGDRVCDTEPQIQYNTCGLGNPCGNGISYNVMDYLPQTCILKFTPGQVERAINAMNLSLQPYLTQAPPEPWDCPELQANIGDPCDDGDAGTADDKITTNCDCEGTPIVAYDCPEKELNVGDQCHNAYLDTDDATLDENCNCIPNKTFHCCDLKANIGDNCDDGNPLTENDRVNESCECVGTPTVEPQECYASVVLEYLPGLQKNGSPLPGDRTNPDKALGIPESNDTYNFVTLGFGGTIVLGFEGAIPNGEGNDFAVVETSFGNATYANYPESADVFVSQDGIVFYLVGEVVTGETKYFDIDASGVSLEYATSIKLVDTSPTNNASQDGFDLDGIISVHGCIPDPIITSLRQYDNPSDMKVHPNPAGDFLTVVSDEKGEIRIYDLTGKQVGVYDVDGETTEMYIGGLMPGMYFAKKGSSVVKFVKD